MRADKRDKPFELRLWPAFDPDGGDDSRRLPIPLVVSALQWLRFGVWTRYARWQPDGLAVVRVEYAGGGIWSTRYRWDRPIEDQAPEGSLTPAGIAAGPSKKRLWASAGLASAAAVSVVLAIVLAGGSTATSGRLGASAPLVRGLKKAQAKARIIADGLRVDVDHVDRPGVTRGTVIRQTPAAGTRVKRGGEVTIYVAGDGRGKSGSDSAPGSSSAA